MDDGMDEWMTDSHQCDIDPYVIRLPQTLVRSLLPPSRPPSNRRLIDGRPPYDCDRCRQLFDTLLIFDRDRLRTLVCDVHSLGDVRGDTCRRAVDDAECGIDGRLMLRNDLRRRIDHRQLTWYDRDHRCGCRHTVQCEDANGKLRRDVHRDELDCTRRHLTHVTSMMPRDVHRLRIRIKRIRMTGVDQRSSR